MPGSSRGLPTRLLPQAPGHPSRHGPANPEDPAFLLLPGDGLLLLDHEGTVLHADPAVHRLKRAAPRSLDGSALASWWPQLAELTGAYPVDAPIQDWPVPLGEDERTCRLFHTDNGIGVGVLLAEPAEGPGREQLQLLGSMLESVQDAILLTSAEPHLGPGPVILYANTAMLQQSGYSLREVLGRSPRLFQGEGTSEEGRSRFRRAVHDWQQVVVELVNYRRDGQPYWSEIKASPLADPAGRFTHWVSVQRDVTARHEAEQRLIQQAFSDDLTGLPNRRGMTIQLEQSLVRLGRQGGRLALIFCDLDRFKEINDRHGHGVGDQLLLEVARRLGTQLRQGDSLARIGGDEFVVLAENVSNDDDAFVLAERLRGSLLDPWLHLGMELPLSMSFGVATTTLADLSAEELLRRADITMYQVKAAGRDGVAIYNQAVDEELSSTLSMRHRLQSALREGSLYLDYQPLVDLPSGALLGAEALVRLRGGTGETVSPDAFLPVAERTGLILPLERWVIAAGLDTLAQWQRLGLPHRLSLNLSPSHLERGSLVEDLLAHRDRTGVDLAGLTMEITESVLLRHEERAISEITRLREVGVTVALDDFGTGYSSLAWLSRIPIDEVKIDRSFITPLPHDPRIGLLVQGFVRMFQELGLRVVAEGIETVAQRDALLAMGCRRGQGWLFGRPGPLEALETAAFRAPASSRPSAGR